MATASCYGLLTIYYLFALSGACGRLAMLTHRITSTRALVLVLQFLWVFYAQENLLAGGNVLSRKGKLSISR